MIPDILIVARANRYGLTRDAALLAEALRKAGASVEFAERRSRGMLGWLLRRKRARTVIHLERAFPSWFGAGERNWLVPNQERFPARHVRRLAHVDLVLAKTRHAQEVFSRLGSQTRLVGFTSEDRLDPAVVKDWQRFFHLAGGSTLKGTEDLLDLWGRNPQWPELVLVQKADNAPASVPRNVTLVSGYLDDAELRRPQNACGIHLCPSRAEGWGHHIVEGLSAGSVVVTTDGPPMNELVDAGCGVLVPVHRSEPRHLGTCHFADVGALGQAVEGLLALPDAGKAQIGAAARARYEALDSDFTSAVAALVAELR